jgi:hypothetical protein
MFFVWAGRRSKFFYVGLDPGLDFNLNKHHQKMNYNFWLLYDRKKVGFL